MPLTGRPHIPLPAVTATAVGAEFPVIVKEADPVSTTNTGIPVESDQYSLTVGADGPILLQDNYLIEKMAQFNRERIPERVVHAKGSGAYATFEVTNDVTQFTAADVFQPGRRTRMLARFSTVAGEQGSPTPGGTRVASR